MQSYYAFKNTNKIDNDLISLNNLMWGILKNEFVKSKKYVLMLKLTKKFIWIDAITHAFKKKKKKDWQWLDIDFDFHLFTPKKRIVDFHIGYG